MTIKTYLDLSTAHLRQATVDQLQAVGDHKRHDSPGGQPINWPAMSVASYEYGVFISVPDLGEDLSQMPTDLEQVLCYAQRIGLHLIRFDRDGLFDPELPTYDHN